MRNRFDIGGWLGAKTEYSSFPAIVEELTHEGHEPSSYEWPVTNPERQRHIQAQRDRALAAR